MSLYTELAADAEELIAEFGQQMTFSRTVHGDYDPSAGGSSQTTVTWTGNVVVQPASQGTIESFDVRVVDGTLIESNLRSLLISAAMERAPEPGDKVAFEGSTWTLLGATPLNPSGTPLIYTATARR